MCQLITQYIIQKEFEKNLSISRYHCDVILSQSLIIMCTDVTMQLSNMSMHNRFKILSWWYPQYIQVLLKKFGYIKYVKWKKQKDEDNKCTRPTHIHRGPCKLSSNTISIKCAFSSSSSLPLPLVPPPARKEGYVPYCTCIYSFPVHKHSFLNSHHSLPTNSHKKKKSKSKTKKWSQYQVFS